jgi:hypothetical protein
LGVFVVRHDPFDKRGARGKINPADDAVFVATNIEDEHDQVFFASRGVHAVEVCFEFCEILGFDAAQVVVPVAERLFGFGMMFREGAKGAWRDDVHSNSVLQNAIIVNTGMEKPMMITEFVSNSHLETQLFDHHSHNNSSASQTVAACRFIFRPFSNVFSNLFGGSVIYPVRFHKAEQFKNLIWTRLLNARGGWLRLVIFGFIRLICHGLAYRVKNPKCSRQSGNPSLRRIRSTRGAFSYGQILQLELD